VAGNVLGSMAGWHGLTMSEEVTNPAKQPGQLWAQMGVHFVHRTFEAGSYASLIRLILVMLVIAWFLPNTQQMLAGHGPVLEKTGRPRCWYLTLGWRDGLVLGGLFFLVVRGFYIAPPSPFIYFHF